jgi:acylphosphatase
MPAMHILIAGRVQGVGFRWFARVAARRLELSGWVRNRDDGTVEVAASGPQDRLDQFRRQLSRGPDAASVEEIRELDPVEGELDFPFAMRR